MNLEKITADIKGKKYSFTVESIPSEDPIMIYRAVPDDDDPMLRKVINGYLDFDDKGNVTSGEDLKNADAKEVTSAIWQAIDTQVIHQTQE